MTITLYDLAGAEADRHFSPFCWRARMALAHKGLDVETVPCRFTEKDKLPQPNVGRVPVIVDGDRVVRDSTAIADYLEHVPLYSAMRSEVRPAKSKIHRLLRPLDNAHALAVWRYHPRPARPNTRGQCYRPSSHGYARAFVHIGEDTGARLPGCRDRPRSAKLIRPVTAGAPRPCGGPVLGHAHPRRDPCLMPLTTRRVRNPLGAGSRTSAREWRASLRSTRRSPTGGVARVPALLRTGLASGR
jgi:hypothetical protein